MRTSSSKARRALVVLCLAAGLVSSGAPGTAGATEAAPPDDGGKAAAPADAAEPELIPNRYIVRFVAGSDAAAEARAVARGPVEVKQVFEHVFPGALLHVPPQALAGLQRNPRIQWVEQDARVQLVDDREVGTAATQPNPPWGLDRIDQRRKNLSNSYDYNGNGTGVTAYVVDTGIRRTHNDFGGRVGRGFSSIRDGRGADDCNGHGTHVAGTIGGTTYGVAKRVQLRPVRVLDCDGGGSIATVVSGFNWIVGHHQAGQPAVANASLGGPTSRALDSAARAVIDDGVTLVVAAGNYSVNACTGSPARVAPALTVGATDRADARAEFSNFGSCLDLFAPGVNIRSAWHTGNNASQTISGTSMAAPHVAGFVALHLQRRPNATPAAVARTVTGLATADQICGAGTRSPNLLLYSPVRPASPAPQPPPGGGGPANDNFANARQFTLSGTGSVSGTNVCASKEAGEPNHANLTGGASVWWKFTASSTRQVTIHTRRSNFDTVLAVYRGNSVSSLTHVASNDDSGGLQSSVTFNVTAGTTYRVAVDGYGGAQGSIRLNWVG
jgi:aqualysin 1